MVHLSARLDPETAAPIKGAIEAIVTHAIRSRRTAPGATECEGDTVGAPVVEDDRTVPQLQADALALIARHVIGCNRMPSAPSMAVVVRAELEVLTTGIGHAGIDGLDHPVSAGTVRKMAASAGIIPAVLDGDSLPLDLGRASRLFSWGQRIALGERDGGCACCGLDIAYTEAHHIEWWERDAGPSDLENGVLLCPPCHTRIHDDGWVIRVVGGQVWFIPPPHVDPQQEPRLGGRVRFGMPRVIDAA
jgi:Predicted restriction endonuclease